MVGVRRRTRLIDDSIQYWIDRFNNPNTDSELNFNDLEIVYNVVVMWVAAVLYPGIVSKPFVEIENGVKSYMDINWKSKILESYSNYLKKL
jgi:hypothetical protein